MNSRHRKNVNYAVVSVKTENKTTKFKSKHRVLLYRKTYQLQYMGGGGGGTQERFILRDSTPRSKHLPFNIPLLTGKVTSSYSFHRKWYPFHIPTGATHYFFFSFSFFFFFFFWGGGGGVSVQDIFKGPFKYLNDSFPHPFLTLQLVKYLHFYITPS